ncbi:MAG: gamma-glutamyltransferase family protein [Proteobacteria bacterium]|jgi:gamma-glutamyltranspeptidase/glutathione hydrolase|nr:gamma-glutamyltransferase family protein [Pseudomonadota bacterium]
MVPLPLSVLNELDWTLPYPSQRAPVLARNIVATSQPLATQAGIAALRAGGNAVDAALAAAITLTVVEPNNNGIGSDAFALIWADGSLHGLNGSGRSPAGLTPERFAGRQSMPVLGWDAVTVPGAVSMWVALSDRFGCLPFADLFTDAIRHAREGYQVGPVTGASWPGAVRRFAEFPAFQSTFTLDGRAPRIGETMFLPDHGATLQAIADSHGESFYRGDLAEAMVQDAARHGGALTLADLDGHRCDWVAPLTVNWQDFTLHEIPPNGQGLMAQIALGILSLLDIDHYALDSADSVHLQVEAIRRAYGVVERQLADPDFMSVDPRDLLSPGYLRSLADTVDLHRVGETITLPATGPDTVYLTAADANGMMVSLIQSNYQGFGSGVVVPGTGISLQNRGSGFTLEPGHPNQVAGGKRPFHTIIPGFVTRQGKPVMSFGVMGGHMQAQGHVQMMVRIIIHGQNPQAASDAPRWHLTEAGRLALEPGFNTTVAKDLSSRGHDLFGDLPAGLFGGAQLIVKLDDGYCGASDHRKEGHAAGF